MFRKKKDKKRDDAAKNVKNLAKKSCSPPPARESPENLDDTDGFDEDGFVDLQPIESDGTLLGPRQKCKVFNPFLETFTPSLRLYLLVYIDAIIKSFPTEQKISPDDCLSNINEIPSHNFIHRTDNYYHFSRISTPELKLDISS